jgi:hypothetical protein
MSYAQEQTIRATRSLLADHIRGARNTVRKLRADADAQRNTIAITGEWSGIPALRLARLEGSLFEAKQNLQGLRYLSAEFRGRKISN